jgi:NAD(P)-dependent dehydrogenase (short-subunit alcohol dehydrogenase family)
MAQQGALEGMTVLITGGNGGIGLGMATGCANAGANLVLWGRSADKNAAAADALASTGATVHTFTCDIANEDSVNETFAASVDVAGGRIDSVFANAGTTGNGSSFLDVDMKEWRRVLDTNLDGTFLTLRAGARHLVETGGKGSMVAVSSTASIHGAANNEAYGASKSAVVGLVRALAVALGKHQIRVNALLPGWTKTELAGPAYAFDRFREGMIRRTPLGRWAEPEEMAAAGVFLADPTNSFHTGNLLVVDGGYTLF